MSLLCDRCGAPLEFICGREYLQGKRAAGSPRNANRGENRERQKAHNKNDKSGSSSMSILIRETVPLANAAMPTTLAYGRLAHADKGVAAQFARIGALSLLGTTCTAASLLFLISLGIAMPVLAEQVGAWLASGRWDAVPAMMILTRTGYVPDFDGSVIGSAANWLLSCDTGFLILLAASIFGGAVWIFERARSRLELLSWGARSDA
jgi:hypothetical protein